MLKAILIRTTDGHCDGGVILPNSALYNSLDKGTRRWSTFGPWYAMFPVDFALDVISNYSGEGDLVVDPFCGRGTSLYAAGALDRKAFGIEINAVGWSYASTKVGPAGRDLVMRRLKAIARKASKTDLPDLPRFFVKAYAPDVRRFLVQAREELDWQNDVVDRTAMSMLLLYAHGNRKNAFSNQMRQTKAMSPAYALRWWDERDLNPPKLDPIDFLESRLRWRYRHGSPDFSDVTTLHGDSTVVLKSHDLEGQRWSLLLTSPPYMKVANYHYDQWIRLWLLGGLPRPIVNGGENQSWFGNREKYKTMLSSVFSILAKTARRNAVVYVRTDARKETRNITIDVLKGAFPRKEMTVLRRPVKGKKTQTALYNDVSSAGEIDIVLM